MINSSMLIIPIPSGVGVTEIFLKNVIAIITGSEEIAQQSTFIYRFFTYYLVTVMTAIPFITLIVKTNIEKSRKKNTGQTFGQ